MKNVLLRMVLCFAPLAFTPLFGYLIAEGVLSFGGGEKDLVMLFPWLIWSIAYAVGFIVLWVKKAPLYKTVRLSFTYATLLIAVLWVVVFFGSF